MPITNLIANLCIRSKWFISATRFGEQACMPNSRCGNTKSLYNWMKTDFERSVAGGSIKKINRLAFFAASLHGAEVGNKVSLWTPKSSVY